MRCIIILLYNIFLFSLFYLLGISRFLFFCALTYLHCIYSMVRIRDVHSYMVL